jgi:hypothetical protein
MHGTLSQPLRRYASILALDPGKFNSVLCRFDPALPGLPLQRQVACEDQSVLYYNGQPTTGTQRWRSWFSASVPCRAITTGEKLVSHG